MATWVDLPGYKKTYKGNEKSYYEHSASGKAHISLQYDEDSLSPTSVTLRFEYNADSGLHDKFDILLRPTDAVNRTLIHLKTKHGPGSGTGPYHSDIFKLGKAYTSPEFEMPTYWICNLGSRTMSSAQECYNHYNYNGGGGADGWLGRVMRTTVAAEDLNIVPSRTVAKAGSNPSIGVSDRGNNTVGISGTLGGVGDNNAIKSATLYYTIDGSDPKTSDTRKSIAIKNSSDQVTGGMSYPGGVKESDKSKFTVSISKNCTVRAYIKCEFTYNTTSATGSANAKYYAKPSNPGKPILSSSSFRNNRLTIKQDWGWEWPLSAATNTDSPVKGYRIRLYVNDSNNPIVNYYTGDAASSELEDFDWVYDRTSTSYPMPMRATDQAIVPGDTVALSIQAYSTNGVGTKLLSSVIMSDTYTVQNAGVVNIKMGEWTEGQVWVKVNDKWQEAETVSVKAGNAWQESQ